MNGISRVGSAYILKRVAGSWETHAKPLLPAAQWADSIQFGQAVAIRGDLLAIMRHDHFSGCSRIQLYRRHGDVWERETELVGPAGNTYRNSFRSSVVIGEDCVVSACAPTSSPQALTYHRLSSAGWRQEQTIPPSPPNVKTNGGKVYLYQVSDSPWMRLRTFGGKAVHHRTIHLPPPGRGCLPT